MIWLAYEAAKKQYPISDEQLDAFRKAVLNETKRGFPPGFINQPWEE